MPKKEEIKKEENKRMLAEKWARQENLDITLFKWWSDKGELMTRDEFLKIKKQLYRSE